MKRHQQLTEFERLMLPHLEAAYSLARWITGNPTDADDVVQEAYLRAFRAFDRYRDDNPLAWLLTIVRNTSYRWLQVHRRHAGHPYDDELLHHNTVEITRNLRPPEQQLLAQAERDEVRQAVARLPDPLREALVLREMQGLAYREIARVLGIPLGTVMSRLSRARAHLQRMLAGGGAREENAPCSARPPAT